MKKFFAIPLLIFTYFTQISPTFEALEAIIETEVNEVVVPILIQAAQAIEAQVIIEIQEEETNLEQEAIVSIENAIL